MEGFAWFLLFLALAWFVVQIRKGYRGDDTSRSNAPLRTTPSGNFPLDVVGESHYQAALERVCGGRCKDGFNKPVTATLVLENSNRNDKNAVRVDINEATVGYLSRDNARRYRKALKMPGDLRPRTCPAVIRGGWDRAETIRVTSVCDWTWIYRGQKLKSFIRLIALLVILAPSPGTAQTFWNGTTYGMSVAQVKSKVPKASPPSSNPSHLKDGSVELLRLDGINLANDTFTASFYFQAQKLSQVTLSLDKGRSFQSAMLVFDSISDALRAKYGRELDRRVTRGVLSQAESQWLSGRTQHHAVSVGCWRI